MNNENDKHVKEKLRESEENFRVLFDENPLPTVMSEMPSGLIAFANKRMAEILGMRPEEIIGKTANDLALLKNPVDLEKLTGLIASRGYVDNLEVDRDLPDGSKGTGLVSMRLVTIDKKQYCLTVIQDVTERKRAENLVAIQHELALSLNTASSIDTWLEMCLDAALKASGMDCGGIYLVNETDNRLTLAVHTGLSPAFIASASHYDAQTPNSRLVLAGKPVYSEHAMLGLPLDDLRRNERLRALAVIPVTYQGSVIGCFNLASHTCDDVPVFARGALETIAAQIGAGIARLKSQEALKASEQKYRDLADSLPLVIFEMDMDGLLTYVNRTAFDWFGYSRDDLPKGINMLELIVEQDRAFAIENIRKVAGLGETASSEYSVRRKTGDIFPVLAVSHPIVKDGKTIGIRGMLLDLKERKNFENALNTAQKLESLGILAGGIAHDFNNLLTGIFGYVDLARSVSKEAETKEFLEATLLSMNRARALTLQLLTFAKGGSPVQKTTRLVPFIQETAQFALSGSHVSCTFFLDKNLRQCNIDKNQIGQVIDNIVINAQQAMPGGGSIEISAGNVTLSVKEHPMLRDLNHPAYPEVSAGRPKGDLTIGVPFSGEPAEKGREVRDYVKVSIKDHGIGIPKEILPRIFDPFYTTKAKGHGLGLATSYSIVKRHGGFIDVESEPGKGSTFHLYLPASAEEAADDTNGNSRHKGSGTVIVVDDEEIIRTTFRKMLESLGYSVVCKKDGREAIDFFIKETNADHRFKAMIFDLTIPGGMGGVEAIAEVRKLNTEIPVFVASGYAENSVLKNPVEYGFNGSISKPFTIAELSEMLNKNLIP